MEIKDNYKETINLNKDAVLNYTLKPNAVARLFFHDRAGVDVKINVELEENASCEMYGLFHNEGKYKSNCGKSAQISLRSIQMYFFQNIPI